MTRSGRPIGSDTLAPDDSWWVVSTPFGEMVVAGDDDVVHLVLLPNAAAEALASLGGERRTRRKALARTEQQFEEYFAGGRRNFELPLEPRGTVFQQSVWWALADIPYGETASYADIAQRVGRPTACRAVGLANGSNPLPLVLPCHRVIGSSGKLVGYGGGLELKQQLLEFERRTLADERREEAMSAAPAVD